MKTIMQKTILLGILVAGVAAGSENAAPAGLFSAPRLYTGLHAQVWSYRSTRTWEFVLPLYYSLSLDKAVPGLSVDAVTSPTLAVMSGTYLDKPGVAAAVAGTKARACLNLGDAVLLTAGIQVPTSPNSIGGMQRTVISALAAPQSSFKVSRIQTGLDGSFTAATSFPLSDELTVGIGTGYLLHGGYRPTGTDRIYNPGDEITATAAAEYVVTSATTAVKAGLDFSWTRYGADMWRYTKTRLDLTKVDTVEKAYKNGSRYIINTRLDLRGTDGGAVQAALALNFNTRSAAYDNSGKSWNNPGDQFVLTATRHLPASGPLRYRILGKSALYTPDEKGVTNRAMIGGAGAGVTYVLSRNSSITLQGLLEAGGMDRSFLLGTEISGGISYAF